MRPALLALLLALLPALAFAADAPSDSLVDDKGTPLNVAEFVAEYIPAKMPAGLGRKEIETALNDAGANWVELARAIAQAGTESADKSTLMNSTRPLHQSALANTIWLIVNAPHLDRLELTAAQIESTVVLAEHAGERHGFNPYSDLYRRYLLNYRFDDEPVIDWRAEFVQKFAGDDCPSFAGIAETAATGFTLIDKGYFGNLSDPVSLLHSHAGTKRELSILVAAALRSQGYPTRFVRENRTAESWVEVYSGDPKKYDASAWTPVYPTAPDRTGDTLYAAQLCGGRVTVATAGDAFGREQVTSRYSPVGYVKPVFTHTDPIAQNDTAVDKDFAGWAITAWNDQTGAYVPLDDLGYPAGDEDYPLSKSADAPPEGTYALGPGQYRLECGTRFPGGTSAVQTYEFSIAARKTVDLTVSLDPPANLPPAALVQRQIGNFADGPLLMHQGRYVFLVGDGGEPSMRERELLKPLESRDSVKYTAWRMVGATEAERAFVKDVLKVDEEKDPLPVVVVVVDGVTRMWIEGYNLNVAQWVDRALGASNGG